jgi:hypothetical protein
VHLDGGAALPPSTLDAGDRDAGQHDAGGALVDAARCPFRCGGACSVWPCP